MENNEFPRIGELISLSNEADGESYYFSNFIDSIKEWQPKKQHMKKYEGYLNVLDNASWNTIKYGLVELSKKKHESYGWRYLFDKWNEVIAFAYLRSIGCSNIEFVPTSCKSGEKTPDLRAVLEGDELLCEVKTIGISDVEALRRKVGGVSSKERMINEGFIKKLLDDVGKAIKQIDKFASGRRAKRIVFVYINFDDILGEYADEYFLQIANVLRRQKFPDVDVVLRTNNVFFSELTEVVCVGRAGEG